MKTRHYVVCGILVVLAALSGYFQGEEEPRGSIVTVSGVGTVSIEPDMVRMSVSLAQTARTTRLAQEAVGKMAAQVLATLQEAGVEQKDIKTASLTFNPQYEWRSNRSVLVGQRAEQGIDFAVRETKQDSEKVARLIDRLSAIDGIMMNQISFGIADNTANFVRSRELAFAKAKQKAEQYAALSGRKVDRVLSLEEDGASAPSPLMRSVVGNIFKEEAAFSADAVSTVLPSGQMEVTTRISVVFALE